MAGLFRKNKKATASFADQRNACHGYVSRFAIWALDYFLEDNSVTDDGQWLLDDLFQHRCPPIKSPIVMKDEPCTIVLIPKWIGPRPKLSDPMLSIRDGMRLCAVNELVPQRGRIFIAEEPYRVRDDEYVKELEQIMDLDVPVFSAGTKLYAYPERFRKGYDEKLKSLPLTATCENETGKDRMIWTGGMTDKMGAYESELLGSYFAGLCFPLFDTTSMYSLSMGSDPGGSPWMLIDALSCGLLEYNGADGCRRTTVPRTYSVEMAPLFDGEWKKHSDLWRQVRDLVTIWKVMLDQQRLCIRTKLSDDDATLSEKMTSVANVVGVKPAVEAYFTGVPIEDIVDVDDIQYGIWYQGSLEPALH